ncbi:peptide/nickel transport system ATP-binding protein [Quadrisphaera granulorum]|uniref:Peptide/nickel transport system ATP-binding protein n=1 Tax=Quadrisphaera granulorum TaxID=317664 RepID=A0A316AUM6_9ACTN|nr:ATP-binding cassette domain-containing protein [Quadrisphaera granulorum]PWJ53807.1 peptide/nickel transport system ATP-binding protein [Quadrisphaera granulorum]SZE96564.1 peptide/nickel transport system ATP-binding protein [Quadrisphaera granulorum]
MASDDPAPTAAAETAPVLVVDGLVVRYPGPPPVVAVDGVSLRIGAGEVVALVGESGCGKSSLARAVMGVERRASGTVEVDGAPVAPLGLRRRPLAQTGVQMVFQDPSTSLNPRRSLGAQIDDGAAVARARGSATAEPAVWLERVGLDPAWTSRHPHQLSGGQKQRVAIARALAAAPRLLVADEPISALDASTQTAVAALMRSLTTAVGAALLFISHDLSVVRRIADSTLVMHAGRIVESGPTELLWDDPQHPYTRSLLGAVPVPDGAGRIPAAPTEAERATWGDPAVPERA